MSALCDSYRPFWAAMSGITAATGGVWTVFKDGFIAQGVCGEYTELPERVVYSCGGLICGVPGALAGFAYYLFSQRGTKVFDATATDEDIEAFCSSPAVMAITGIKIISNEHVTKRTLRAIGQCFWLTKIEITYCKNLDGTGVVLCG